MMTYQFYDLRAFANVMAVADKKSFLEELIKHLKKALLIYEKAEDDDEQRRFDFKLMLLMVQFSVDANLLRQKQDDIRLYEEKYCSWKRFFRRDFWRRYIIFPGEKRSIEWKEQPDMHISVKEMIVLASTVYFQRGWGSCDDLRRELQHAVENEFRIIILTGV